LHDVGKIELPRELQDYEPMPGGEHPEGWEQHVRVSFEMIRGRVEPSASQIALHHHQQFNGKGFPQTEMTGKPLAGERIHIFSRIVAVANWYDRRVQVAARMGLPPIVAMKELRNDRFTGVFDPIVSRAFSDLVPPFPIGSLVGLSDSTQAVVLIHNPENPCLPVVRRLGDDVLAAARGESEIEADDVDLTCAQGLFIVTAEGCDVEPFLFGPDEGMGAADPGRRIQVTS
jgi:HD-GYP domain-containing protein (c-di-GMP phosphodiesterase class II)